MTEKKRKTTHDSAGSSAKKSKTKVEPPTGATANAKNEAVTKSKSGRKRAADFLGDEASELTKVQDESADIPVKKVKRSKTLAQKTSSANVGEGRSSNGVGGASLTADGVNGIIEHSSDSEVEITTAGELTGSSLVAEGLRTVDREENSNGEDGSDLDEADQGAALLAGFDSDTEDSAEDKDLDLSKTQGIPNYKKTSKTLREAARKASDGPGTVYVGRIPHGFYEQQMREYFSQFGDIQKLRLSRNRRTGASKHFAFIEFESKEVAKIVAETMDNYLMFGHILKCKYAPAENLHPEVWKGANKKFRRIPHDKLEGRKLQAPKTVSQWEKKNKKEQRKRENKAAKLKQIGYEYNMPTLKSPSSVLQQRKLEQQNEDPKLITSGETAKEIEAPDLSQIDSKRTSEREKISAKAAKPLTQGNLDAQNAAGYVKAPKTGSKIKAATSVSVNTSAAPAVQATDTERAEKKDKKKKASSKVTSTSTDKGDFDSLQSIPIGIDAAGDETAQHWKEAQPRNIETQTGVADAELQKRKKDRKKLKAERTNTKDLTADAKADADVNEIAPYAHHAAKKEQAANVKSKTKKTKGIPKQRS